MSTGVNIKEYIVTNTSVVEFSAWKKSTNWARLSADKFREFMMDYSEHKRQVEKFLGGFREDYLSDVLHEVEGISAESNLYNKDTNISDNILKRIGYSFMK